MDDNSKKLSPLKQAYLALEKMQARLDESTRALKEPIAIIGVGCRFPGGANDLESFWRILCEGLDTIREIPLDRWNKDAFYDSDQTVPGKMSSKWGGFIEGIDKFDPHFFGISPREAMEMDPQQRMILEVSWEALENAGQAPDRLSGSQTAVFSAMATYEYSDLKMGSADLTNFDNYYISGCGPNMMSGRLSYILGLQGPSVTVDTACSSSLTAVHMACQSLRLKECCLALVGGVNAIIQPHLMVAYSKAGLMAKDGRCKTFDAAADGLVRGEGCGVVVLKRLSDALADGDHIHAIIRGSAINQDGPSSGLSAPNGPAQVAVIREALRRSGIDPLSVGYVETHGTGTALGDPIEVQALGEALCKNRTKEKPLYIGSVKTNFGHLEGAAGIVGLIKAILVVKHGAIPASLNFKKPSPLVNWDEISVEVPTRLVPWDPEGQSRIAGVSAFGFGGTNVHVTLEQTPEQNGTRTRREAGKSAKTGLERPVHLFTLSAKDEKTLRELAKSYENYLSGRPSVSVADACFTANAGRTHFEHRMATAVVSVEQLRGRLKDFVAQEPSEEILYGLVDEADASKVAFLFTRQEAHYTGIGRLLYETQPTFRASLDCCDELLRPYLDKPLLSLLCSKADEAALMADPAYAQPAIFALEYALAELLRLWGIEPSVVLGHGVGEYAAACVAGVMSLEDSIKLIAERGRLFRAISNGDVPKASLVEKRVLDRFYDRACEVNFLTPQIPIISSAIGKSVKGEIAEARYWRDHIGALSRFDDAMKALVEQRCKIFVEIGRDSAMARGGKKAIQKAGGIWLSALREDVDDWQSILFTLSTLYINGASIDWLGFDRDYHRRKTILPSYSFNRKKYWTDDRKDVTLNKLEKREQTGHPVLGQKVYSPLFKDVVFETRYGENSPSFCVDHRIHGRCLMPGAGYLAQALVATEEVFGSGSQAIEQVLFHEPMVFEQGQDRHVQFVLSPEENGAAHFKVFSLPCGAKQRKEEWTLHMNGVVRIGDEGSNGGDEVFDQVKVLARCGQEVDVRSHFQGMEKVGAVLGPRYQGIEKLWHGKNESIAQLVLPDSVSNGERHDYAVHPVLIDMAIQVMGSILMSENSYSSAYLPIAVDRYRVYRNVGEKVWCQTAIHESIDKNAQALAGDILLYNELGSLCAALEGVQLKRTDSAALQRVIDRGFSDWLYEIVWRPMQREEPPKGSDDRQAGVYLIFGGDDLFRDGLMKMIEERGGTCVVVGDGSSFERRENSYLINYGKPEDFRKVFDDMSKQVYDVIFFENAGSVETGESSASELEGRMEKTCGGVLNLVQAMINSHEQESARLWIVTRGVSSVDGGDMIPAVVPGALWGLGRTIAVEHPELSCTRIDLGCVEDFREAKALFDEIWVPSGEDQIALYKGKRYVARLARCDQKREVQLEAAGAIFRDNASYLITGGLGSLGLQIARWMIEKGARHLTLMGRSKPSSEALETIRELEQRGASIFIVEGDVAKDNDVARIVEEIQTSMPPLYGIIHAAGILSDALLLKENWEHFSRVLAPKVAGAWNLHIATKHMPLDFFILFSSTAALLPTHGQSSYATANAFLDSLAYHRQAQGLPALSINWGIWSGGGMAASVGDRERQRWSHQGVSLMKPADALKTLGQVFDRAAPQVVIIPVDWSSFFRYHKGARIPTMLSELTGRGIKSSKLVRRVPDKPDLKQRLTKAAANQRRAILNEYVTEQAAKILKLDDPLLLSPKKPLMDAGLDSLMAVELKDLLSRAVDHKLPATLLFKYSTIEALTDYLAMEVLSIGKPVETENSVLGAEEVQTDVEDLKAFSDAEISNLIREELSSLSEDLLNEEG